MSCVKSYTYPISASGGSGGFLGGLFFGGKGGGGHTKYHISVNILGGDGRFKPVRLIADTGNDITLLTKQTGNYLGFSPGIGTPLEVSGIRPGMVSHFEKIRTKIQLGDLQPIEAEIGFALEDGALQENLLGNKGILSSGRYEFHYDHDSLTILDRVNNCDMTNGMAQAKAQYSHLNKNKDNEYWDYYFSRNFY